MIMDWAMDHDVCLIKSEISAGVCLFIDIGIF